MMTTLGQVAYGKFTELSGRRLPPWDQLAAASRSKWEDLAAAVAAAHTASLRRDLDALARTFADFGDYPPAENFHDGTCPVCDEQVHAHEGVTALRDGTKATALHHGCADTIRTRQSPPRRRMQHSPAAD